MCSSDLLLDRALLPADWAERDADGVRALLAERTARWDPASRDRLRQRRREAVAGLEAMLDSLAALAGVGPSNGSTHRGGER